MNKEDYHWYSYLKYQEQCKKEGKEDTVQEWLILTGRIDPPPNTAVVDSIEPIEEHTSSEPVWENKKEKISFWAYLLKLITRLLRRNEKKLR